MSQASGCGGMHHHQPQSRESALNTLPWVGMVLLLGLDQEEKSVGQRCEMERGRRRTKTCLLAPIFHLGFLVPLNAQSPLPHSRGTVFPTVSLQRDAEGCYSPQLQSAFTVCKVPSDQSPTRSSQQSGVITISISHIKRLKLRTVKISGWDTEGALFIKIT